MAKLSRVVLYSWLATLSIFLGLTVTSCSDSSDGPQPESSISDPGDSSATTGKFRLLLTDNPLEEQGVSAVLVTLNRVDLTFTDDRPRLTLMEEARIIDLLELQNGVTTLLGEVEIPPGQVGQIRLIVEEASLVVHGEVEPLFIPSGEQTGIKLDGPFDVGAGCEVEVTLDFDAEKSVSHNRGKGWMLKPVIEIQDVTETCDGNGGADDDDLDLPPDPATVAPPLDPTHIDTFYDRYSFLFDGADPIQTGMEDGALEPERMAVVRGKVFRSDGRPLAGVRVEAFGHEEVGHTLTRSDGQYDLVVNGGGSVTVRFSREGYLASDRRVRTKWENFVHTDDVVLLPWDENVTTIDFTAPIQVARGSEISDIDGERQATLLFFEDTEAELHFRDGSTQPLDQLNVRLTEFTVAPFGEGAMPGELPPGVAYTYAVEMSADEAIERDAVGVHFSKPVHFYVENFIGFPTGGIVPMGYYDRELAAWIASDNGRVIEISSVAPDGLAVIDVDGVGEAATTDDLQALGFTGDELATLAELYEPGTTLWRVPVTHFTPWDCNWPYGPPDDVSAPEVDPALLSVIEDPCIQAGSIIECENQVLRKSIDVPGTPHQLTHRSENTPGFTAARRIKLLVTGEDPPASLRRVVVEVSIAGQQHEEWFGRSANQVFEWEWDGRDAYDRILQGTVPYVVKIGFEFPLLYKAPPEFERSFGRISNLPMTANVCRRNVQFGPDCNTITLWQTIEGTLGGLTGAFDVGGWMLTHHHRLDPESSVVFQGDGTRRQVGQMGPTITTVAGNGANGFPTDGPALDTPIGEILDFTVGPQGDIYVVPGSRRSYYYVIDRAGVGRRVPTPFPVHAIAVNETHVYLSSDTQIHRHDPVTDTFETIAGGGLNNEPDFEGPATEKRLGQVHSLFVAPDQSVYFTNIWNHIGSHTQIWRVTADGWLTLIAGSGVSGYDGDGQPATDAALSGSRNPILHPSGELYFSDFTNNRVRKVGVDGIIETVVGNGLHHFNLLDGSQAPDVRTGTIRGIALDAEGLLYFTTGDHRVYRLNHEGIVEHVAGTWSTRYDGENKLATKTPIGVIWTMSFAPNGDLYLGDATNRRLRKVSSALMRSLAGGYDIPAEDESEIYAFDRTGRHLETIDTLTGTRWWTFGYDGGGRLETLTNQDGLTTAIERNADGLATAIVGPYGHRAAVTTDPAGRLASVQDAAGATYSLNHNTVGLLESVTDAMARTTTYAYATDGRLIQTRDALDARRGFNRIDEVGLGFTVEAPSPMGRMTKYFYRLDAMGVAREVEGPDGLAVVSHQDRQAQTVVIYPDGSTVRSVQEASEKFGGAVIRPTATEWETPAGLLMQRSVERTTTWSSEAGPPRIEQQEEVVTINGRSYTTTTDMSTQQRVFSSPAGRQMTQSLDHQGRPVLLEVPGILPTSITYDADGRPDTITQGDRTQVMTYNSNGFLDTLSNTLDPPSTFAYDPIGRLTEQTGPDERSVAFAYDQVGNLTSLVPSSGAAHRFDFTPVDLVSDYEPPLLGGLATPTRYAYDLDREPTTVELPDGNTIGYRYDVAGRLSSLETRLATYTYGYDEQTGKLTSLAGPDGEAELVYDGPLLLSTTLPLGTVSHTYDANFRVTEDRVSGGNAVTFAYDTDGLLTRAGALNMTHDAANGLLTSATLGGLTTTWDYNDYGEPEAMTARRSGQDVYDYQLNLDARGRITQKIETLAGVSTTHEYEYDVAGRLLEEWRDGVLVQAFSYDENDNRTGHIEGQVHTSVTYDAQDRLETYGDRIYTFDDNGTLDAVIDNNSEVTVYDYDVFGQLRGVDLPGGTRISYDIDPLGRRAARHIDGTFDRGWLYKDALNPIAEVDAQGNVTTRFVYGTRPHVPDYMVTAGHTYRLISDHLGSVRLVVNTATGHVAQRLDYDAFGRVIEDTNPGFQPFGFAGGLYDADTGLVRFGARDYDAFTGRWTAKDPIGFGGGDANLYGYVGQDPVSLVDPTGQIAWKFVAGFLVAGGAYVAGVNFGLLRAPESGSNNTQRLLDRARVEYSKNMSPGASKTAVNKKVFEGLSRERAPLARTCPSSELINAEHYMWNRLKASDGGVSAAIGWGALTVSYPAVKAAAHFVGLESMISANDEQLPSRPTGDQIRWGFRGLRDGLGDR